MTSGGDEPRVGPAGGRLIAIIAGTALGVGLVWLADPRSPEVAEPPAGEVTVASTPAAEPIDGPAPPPLPDGALPPLLGPKTERTTSYCDEGLWTNVTPMIIDVDGDTIRLEETAWSALSATARSGIASYLSKCHADGRPIEIYGHPSNTPLASYPPPRTN